MSLDGNKTVFGSFGNESRVGFCLLYTSSVAKTHRVFPLAEAAGTEVISEIELGLSLIHIYIVLSVPEDSVVPYYVEAATSVTGNIGTFNPDGTSITVTPCIVQIAVSYTHLFYGLTGFTFTVC